MKKLKNFQHLLESSLQITSWNVSEAQLCKVANLIVELDRELTENDLLQIFESSGITSVSRFFMEGLDYGRMIALLSAAKDFVAKDGKDDVKSS